LAQKFGDLPLPAQYETDAASLLGQAISATMLAYNAITSMYTSPPSPIAADEDRICKEMAELRRTGSEQRIPTTASHDTRMRLGLMHLATVYADRCTQAMVDGRIRALAHVDLSRSGWHAKLTPAFITLESVLALASAEPGEGYAADVPAIRKLYEEVLSRPWEQIYSSE
jgi:hypothetical protein